ncbi:MAG TPA: 6-hydroxycyclohex-1-ene-1-carbonyl-CoA dehydrogenase [Planctomycetes bacterium]|nr:6-hydroxycyclohex-1-ene-1-carbonyl-CoA dehydrogenase [Planctomycetota bacterium]
MTAVGEPLVRTTFPLEEVREGRARVRVVGCGVCHTDLGYLFDGVKPRAPLPLALGHEISGVVEEAARGFEHLVGKAVIVPAVTPCGKCSDCEEGWGTICSAQEMPGNDVQGGFASHVDVLAHGLCEVGPASLESADVVENSGCTLAELSVVADAVTTPYQAMSRAKVREGDFVVVIGLGGVGGFAAQIASALGAKVVGFDLDAGRLELLGSHGVDLALDPTQNDARGWKKKLRAFAEENGCSPKRWKIFECSGSTAGQALAYGLLVHGAYLGVVGYTMGKLEVRLSNLMAFDAKAAGNWGCLPKHYPGALRLVLDGKVAVKPFVETFPLEEVQSVLDRVHAHELGKRAVLLP